MAAINITTDSKQYPLYIGSGIISELPKVLQQLTNPISKILIITDNVVAPLYLEKVVSVLARDYATDKFIISHGETAKNIDTYYECHTCALTNGLDRSSLILALGGGVVGDVAGFVAATYQRGIPFIQIPTTLLAHDSAVGGKVAINHSLGKNMIGAFHQPEAVVYDTDFLETLPKKELLSGFAEVIKEAIIWDKDFYKWIKENIMTFSDLNGDQLQYAIQKGIAVKAEIVSKDERENGIRAFLNFGHTLGHAIEAELGYGEITHGEAVLIGMLYAIKVSEQYFEKNLNYQEYVDWFKKYGYATTIPAGLDPNKLLLRMKKDKKSTAGNIRMVLLKEVGLVEVHEVNDELLYTLLKSE